MIRKFFLKHQDRILYGSDGNPARGAEEFWLASARASIEKQLAARR
jgi:hypothetical protein